MRDNYEAKKSRLLALAKKDTLTVRDMARRLRVRQEEAMEMVEDLSAWGEEIELIVGRRVGGLGGGVFMFEKDGDFEIDYYGGEDALQT